MAIQQWTIIKLVGPAAADAASRCDRWWMARRSNDMTCFAQDDWPPSVRRAAAAYLARLADHRWETPIAYYSQHIDLWLGGGQIQVHLGDTPLRVLHDMGELWCYRLPDRGKLIRRNSAPARSTQFAESEWLAQRIIEAVRAYDKMWPQATLLVNRQAIAASPGNEELKAAATVLPKWIGRSTVR